MVRDPLIPRLVSVTEAADIVGCSRQNINVLINDGKLPAARAGTTLVMSEDTVRRYAAGERFGFPTLLVISAFDEAADGWIERDRKAVPPDYALPPSFTAEDIGAAAGGPYRVELLDNSGKTLAIKAVETEAAS
ncbi:helix-turn-helix domain-containing protein [Amycolatopsis azurea]|uniref:helix-turn-helix domain-containing protein n=1 Tax=Amycolatopsis azurea TaxID=36819 RepID=UPI003806DC6F